MRRLTRAETQERNRAKVLAAAQDEFTERGFRDAKIDGIAERAGLTRGAVYSNFPGKRALYFAVLADLAERSPRPPRPESVRTARDALGAFARAWVTRLPLAADDRPGAARLGMDLMPEIASDERIRQPYAQLMKLDAILLGLALERLRLAGAPPDRLVRVAEAVLTTLHGVSQMAAAAPGFVEPFDAVSVCEQLADLDMDGGWSPPHMPWIPPARPADEPWSPPHVLDAVRGESARLTGDGVVAILGLHRLEAVEEAVRAAPPDVEVTAVLVTGDPDELGPLARLAVADLCTCLRQAFPPAAWPRLQVVHDAMGTLAAVAGVPAVSDATETAVRVAAGRIVARADGRGACHAVATVGGPAAKNR
ncbi:TetR/AcrR family transcriptional regulator [Microtetraspora sp. NBRC 16547]|uniref:TetR/AcrR family transcriptional regulator n=1 Tax=Microtetraspora sp. NBRC 16547 TaxID=3030993 RepID=UPI0024A51D72|nr:TetR/AcrR family transcriptional regulator [Microtetraspora sp. NBRC 16547]GLX00576.1 TetR family transcriptional regulator [Microtetraspora sp. NBRC 16547]